jgi:hypothetical protein
MSDQQVVLSQLPVIFTDVNGTVDKLTIANIDISHTGTFGNIKISGATVDGQVLTANGTSGATVWKTINIATGNIAPLNLNGISTTVLNGVGGWTTLPTVGTVGVLNTTGATTTWLRGDGTWANIAIPSVGTVGQLSLNNSTTQYLRGDGQWTTISGPGTGVTQVNTAGSGLGFSLAGGPITTTGTVTLSTPTANDLRTTLNIGNVANINLTGETNKVLLANGGWTEMPTTLTVGTVAYANYPSVNTTTTWLRGDGQWVAPPGGTNPGTVTSVAVTTSSGGLGFTVSGGPITSSGTITLNIPTAAALRTNLGLGNVALTNFSGTVSHYLKGDGTWGPITGTGTGTVTQVDVAGSGLGFALSGGPITGTGTVTLATPTAGALRGSLTIGTVANANFSGNTLQWLRGDGTWSNISVPTVGTVGALNTNGSTTQFLRGDGTWQTIAATGNISSINLNGVSSQFLAGTGGWVSYGNIISINKNGSTSQFLRGDGTWAATAPTVAGGTTQIQYNGGGVISASANLTFDGQTFSTPLAKIGSLQELKMVRETVNENTSQITGTYQYDLLSGSIHTILTPLTSNIIVNFRGNSQSPYSTLSSTNGQSITATLIFATGATAYTVSSITIDGAAKTISWQSGTAPTVSPNSYMCMTFTIIRTATVPGWLVLGSCVRYA